MARAVGIDLGTTNSVVSTLSKLTLRPPCEKKLSLFHSSLLTSTQTCVKLEYMRLKGSLTGQHPSTSSPCMRSV